MSEKTPRQRLDYAGAIERLRRGRGMTQEALAEASGISPSYLSEVERGHKRPSTDVMVKIAEALEMSPRELLAFVEKVDVAFGMLERAHPSPGGVARPSARRAWRMRRAEGEEGPASASALLAMHAPDAPAALFDMAPEERDPALRDVELESRDHALGTLMALANRLEEEDLRVLISLARRMGRAGG